MSENVSENVSRPEAQSEPEPEPLLRTEVSLNEETLKRIGRGARRGFLFAMIAGAVGLVLWIVLSAVFETFYEEGNLPWYESVEPIMSIFLLLFAVCFAVGLIFFFSSNLNNKRTAKLKRSNRYGFYEHSFTVTDLREGEDLGTIRNYYTDLFRVREIREFFLLYPNSVTYFPVDKRGLTEPEIEELRRVLKLKK